MIKIKKKDLWFAVKLATAFEGCPERRDCLFGDLRREADATEGCQIILVWEDLITGKKGGYQGECPLFEFAQKLDGSPFFATWKDIEEKRKKYLGKKRRPDHFSKIILNGIEVLHSANKRRFPPMSQTFIERITREAETQSERFFRKAHQELRAIHSSWIRPSWFDEFYELARKYKVTGYSWNLVVLLLTILLEGIKESERPLPEPEEMVAAVEEFLAHRGKGA